MKLNTARIFVRDLETAQTFYRDALGLSQRGGDLPASDARDRTVILGGR
jgi:catechol 2,3-dioxygenase-like lactoylglutathione lyase family enzyme